MQDYEHVENKENDSTEDVPIYIYTQIILSSLSEIQLTVV